MTDIEADRRIERGLRHLFAELHAMLYPMVPFAPKGAWWAHPGANKMRQAYKFTLE